MAQGVWRGVRARARAPPPALCSVAQRTESAPLAPDILGTRGSLPKGKVLEGRRHRDEVEQEDGMTRGLDLRAP